MIQSAIGGKTEMYGLIGSPVAHSFSPVIHNTLAAALGHDMAYAAFDVPAEGVEQALRGAHALGVMGLNVTVPHKSAVMPFLSAIDPLAEAAGAVNTLVRTSTGYAGFNTDCVGIAGALEAGGVSMGGRDVVILGAGGGARAAAAAAAEAGARRIFVANRTESRAMELVRHIKKYYNINIEAMTYNEALNIAATDIVIQATSAGMNGGAPPVGDMAFLGRAGVAFDIIYSPWETEFLRLAKAAGCVCLNGFDMLVLQAFGAFELWRGVRLETGFKSEMLRSLREYYCDGYNK